VLVAGWLGGEVDPPVVVDVPEGGGPELFEGFGRGEEDFRVGRCGGDGGAAPDSDVAAGCGEEEVVAVDRVEGDEGVGVGEDGVCRRGLGCGGEAEHAHDHVAE